MEKQSESSSTLNNATSRQQLVEINETSRGDDLSELKTGIDDLIKQSRASIDTLQSLSVKTQLFICDYFEKIVNDIDYETEFVITSEHEELNRLAQSLDDLDENADEETRKRNEDEFDRLQEKTNSRVDQANKIREIMIKVIRNHEKECLNNYAQHEERFKQNDAELADNLVYQLKQIDIESLELALKSHEKSYQDFGRIVKRHRKLKSKRMVGYTLRSHLESLRAKLANLRDELDAKLLGIKRLLFLNKTCVYVKNLNELENKLLTFDEQVEADVFGRDKSYYLSRRRARAKPTDIGHLITINNFYLTDIEIELIK